MLAACTTSASSQRELLRTFTKTHSPIAVSFRELAAGVAYGERVTHNIHPYPARLLPHIPNYFLRGDIFVPDGNIVVDPFCGSGTVLLESILSGRPAYGADTNPLSVLISSVKTTRINAQAVRSSLKRLLDRLPTVPSDDLPTLLDVRYWYTDSVLKQLVRLRDAIRQVRNEQIRDFFWLAFSVTSQRSSLADPRISVPVRMRQDRFHKHHSYSVAARKHLQTVRDINVRELFKNVVEKNLARFEEYPIDASDIPATVEVRDARHSFHEFGRPVSVITSPPYLGAQKYIRSSSLSLAWLSHVLEDTTLSKLKSASIGREFFTKSETSKGTPDTQDAHVQDLINDVKGDNPLRAHLAAVYVCEMRSAIENISRGSPNGSTLVLISGNNTLCGRPFATSRILRDICVSSGYDLRLHLIDKIRSRRLITKGRGDVIGSEDAFFFTKGTR